MREGYTNLAKKASGFSTYTGVWQANAALGIILLSRLGVFCNRRNESDGQTDER